LGFSRFFIRREKIRQDFKEKEKIQRLLWCDRHCCICEKACGIDIEFAHIDPRGGNDLTIRFPFVMTAMPRLVCII